MVALTAEKGRDKLIQYVHCKLQSGPNSLCKLQGTIAKLFQAFPSGLYVCNTSFGRLKQEDHEFEDSLDYMRLCQQQQQYQFQVE